MAVRLIWSPRSLTELQEIAAYIDNDSPTYARLVVRRMIDRVALSPDMPGQGRRVPE